MEAFRQGEKRTKEGIRERMPFFHLDLDRGVARDVNQARKVENFYRNQPVVVEISIV